MKGGIMVVTNFTPNAYATTDVVPTAPQGSWKRCSSLDDENRKHKGLNVFGYYRDMIRKKKIFYSETNYDKKIHKITRNDLKKKDFCKCLLNSSTETYKRCFVSL